MASIANDAISVSVASQHTAGSLFVIDDSRETMNRILTEVNLSPVRSQATKTLKEQSKGSLRRLVSKLTRGSRIFQGSIINKLRITFYINVIKFREASRNTYTWSRPRTYSDSSTSIASERRATITTVDKQ